MSPVSPACAPGSAEPETLLVIYEDDLLVAVVKPAGMLVHRQAGGPPETAALQRVRNQVGRRVHAIHRLDRGTAGVVVFAKDPATAETLSAQFREGTIAKTYEAIVRGWAPTMLELDYPLRHEERGIVQDARTSLTRLATYELPIAVGRYDSARYSRVRLMPTTGRTHQLRRHMAHLRHPIVGDVRHGDGKHNRMFREEFGIRRLLLLATRLEINHPSDGRRLDLSSPNDAGYDALLQKMADLDLQVA